jgi:hypothetical protein
MRFFKIGEIFEIEFEERVQLNMRGFPMSAIPDLRTHLSHHIWRQIYKLKSPVFPRA